MARTGQELRMDVRRCEVCHSTDVVQGKPYCSMSCQDTLMFRAIGIDDTEQYKPMEHKP